ncbi:DNA-binding protein [Nocardioides lijunqiniae]|uniref:DNA-binding protein n=1 Tax=Nocardioides lijunqiniae TaxID=2760832 RepID=UPI0018778D21|nr:DNA-binding protein [Nocardioides lijunqiniae]
MREPTSPDVTRRDLLTPAQLADRWGVSTGHLANLRYHGEGIGYLKIGSRVAYRIADVIDYENRHYVAVS